MKRLVVLVLCALVVGCGGGGKMAASDPVEVARRIADALEARRIAEAIDGSSTHFHTRLLENYEIARGVLTNSSANLTITEVTNEIIEISGWTSAKFRGTPQTETFKDTFVIYTNSDSPTDTDYVDFGYWLRTDENIGDPSTLSYFVDGFVFGSPPLLEDMETVTGSATYSGPATGMYVKKSGSIYTSGQFKANTMLSVEFGVVVDPINLKKNLVTISGFVTNFTDINDNLIDSTWAVDLNEARHDPKDVTPGLFEPGTTTDVGGVGAGGYWDYHCPERLGR